MCEVESRNGQYTGSGSVMVVTTFENSSMFLSSDMIRCYSAAISACGHGMQWNEAVSLLTDMRARGIIPNEVGYAEIMPMRKGG